MVEYPLKSSGTDMWLISSQKSASASPKMLPYLPASLSEFKPDFWLSKKSEDDKSSGYSDGLLDKWLSSPLVKPPQTTTNVGRRSESISEWIHDGLEYSSPSQDSPSSLPSHCSSSSVSSDCSSIEVLESGFLGFTLIEANKANQHHNKWLVK
eukprot:TRINITY_DN497_c0_g1_i1.p1 TRINITY_DN497_c0_g1~~TRINITY_DN497_c0_g1_i1.p1  ORF type:complete len:153 (-),score=36.17 TRINITY_DN497_c0_g1_i1:493-951(-)